ncbi:MAG: hypothetical protein IH610_09435, partial [Deltaproteobacteria bacterium]|nr:hypothetical protein [Deltaproteobacteria bacterium]
MTEGKPKRSYWRRGPRKKKAAGDAAGTEAATPQVAEGEEPAPESEAAGESTESPSGETEAGSAAAGEVPAKPRRRSRRRGKKKTGDAHAPEPAEGAGEAQAPAEAPPPFEVLGWGGPESPARGSLEPTAAVEAEPAGGEMPAAKAEGPPGT